MPTDCSPTLFPFAPVEGRTVVASFDGGAITSDAGALLLGATDKVLGLTRKLAGCFRDNRNQACTEHAVETLLMQRVVGIALGYEDLNDHDQLRHDPVMAVLAGKLAASRADCAPVAGKSTLNRLELSKTEPTRYHKIAADTGAIEALFVDLFLDAHARAPAQITLDLDATDDPLHGHQEGRFFHGYYDCYCYLPLYVFCGRHLLAAKLRPSSRGAAVGAVQEVARIIARIRARWPRVRILLRGDSGFAIEELMVWAEANRVDYVFGLARNERLAAEIEAEMLRTQAAAQAGGKAARRFRDFQWSTLDSWSRMRRVIGKAEWRRARPILGLSSRLCRGARSMPGGCMRTSTAPAARWKTASRSANSTCSPTAPRRRRCGPTSCGCGSPASPTCCCARCAASAWFTRSLPAPPAARSG